MADIVVGSGFSGAFAAAALLERGREVLMLDAGETLEPERELLRERLAGASPESWSADDLAAYRTPLADAGDGTIRPYGSSFLFRDRESGAQRWPDWFGLRPSLARGGLSNGWGAALLPYRDEDLAAWPFPAAELAPHYRAVAERIPIAAVPDALAELFPAFDVADRRPLPRSAQARALLARFAHAQPALAALGVRVGGARQAVSKECSLCGLCLCGCPWKLIFDAASLVDELLRHERFRYRAEARVTRFEEGPAGVRVRFTGGEIEGDRLFVGAGVLSTTRLVLSSLDLERRPVTLLDSHHFFLPSLHRWSAGGDVRSEPRHTLPQLFLEAAGTGAADPTLHAQIYTFNPAFETDMRRNFRFLSPAAWPLFALLARRLIVFQAFLHSDHSSRVEIRLDRSGEKERLQLERLENPATSACFASSRRLLARAARLAGLLPLTTFARQGAIGSSFHCGGVFPMRRAPGELETDRLGRPYGLSRVHLIDASTFPSIPATTIAFSTMANARRIACEATSAAAI